MSQDKTTVKKKVPKINLESWKKIDIPRAQISTEGAMNTEKRTITSKMRTELSSDSLQSLDSDGSGSPGGLLQRKLMLNLDKVKIASEKVVE